MQKTSGYYEPEALVARLKVGTRVQFRPALERSPPPCPACEDESMDTFAAYSHRVFVIDEIVGADERISTGCTQCGNSYVIEHHGYRFGLRYDHIANGEAWAGFWAAAIELTPTV